MLSKESSNEIVEPKEEKLKPKERKKKKKKKQRKYVNRRVRASW